LAKLNRLGVVVVKQNFQRTTTTEVTDKDLMTHEQALKVLAGAVGSEFLETGFSRSFFDRPARAYGHLPRV